MSEVLESIRSYSSACGSSYSSRRAHKMKVYNLSESPSASKDFAIEEDGCEDFVIMDVGQPVTITVRESIGKCESFTTYLIRVETNYPTFSRNFSAVRRRYSEFFWLRNHLRCSYPREEIPSLPPKKYLRIINFSPKIIEGRCKGLSKFLQRVLETPSFLEDPALVLFIQTELEIEEIEKQQLSHVHPELSSFIRTTADDLEVSSELRRGDSDKISEVEEYWKKHNTLQRADSLETEEEDDSLLDGHDNRLGRKTPSPCSSSGSVKTEDSGHFEDSGSTSSLEKSLVKQKTAGCVGGDAGQKIKSTQLPRKVSRGSEQLPPHRKLSLNDYMAFDPISRYLLGNPSLV